MDSITRLERYTDHKHLMTTKQRRRYNKKLNQEMKRENARFMALVADIAEEEVVSATEDQTA